MDDKDTIRVETDVSEYPATEKVGLLQIIRGEDIGHEYDVRPGNNIIGRQNGCDIQIFNKSISRRHAQIVFSPNELPHRRYIICDLQSTNRIKVNNEVITQCPLRDGDRVQLGTVVCKFMEVDSLEKNYLRELKKLMEYDKQTDLLQIKPFYQRLEKDLGAAAVSQQHLAVLMMDLDGLKQINDRHGHLLGSHVIVEIARLINKEFSPTGAAAIYGGDEFAAYLPNTSKQDAHEKAEHFRNIVADLRFSDKGIGEFVTISIGVAEYPTDASDMMSLMANADKALYTAKAQGKNCVVAYEFSMTETTNM
jgi:diguanylate cyclase (GGDEF)-like protein